MGEQNITQQEEYTMRIQCPKCKEFIWVKLEKSVYAISKSEKFIKENVTKFDIRDDIFQIYDPSVKGLIIQNILNSLRKMTEFHKDAINKKQLIEDLIGFLRVEGGV